MPELLEDRFQNLHEFVTQARTNLNRNNWDYLIGASETETTIARNRLALDAIGFRPRVLRDVSTSIAAGAVRQKAAHPGAVRAGRFAAGVRAGRRRRGRGGDARVRQRHDPLLGVGSGARKDRRGVGRRVQDLPALCPRRRRLGRRSCPPRDGQGLRRFCLTVDTDSYSRRERDIAKRHERRRVRVDDARIYQAQFNWSDIERIKKSFEIPLILKGIATAEDAKIAVEHGVDCVYVSNHGGRQLDQGVGSIEVLPEVVEAVKGRARIIVDGSITRGTDVVKALILGADAVACGRLYVYGLAAAGAEGVVRLFEILEDEIRICLSLLGVTGYHELDKSYIRPARQVAPPHVHSAFPHLNLPRETY